MKFGEMAECSVTTVDAALRPDDLADALLGVDGYVIVVEDGVPFTLIEAERLRRSSPPLRDPAAPLPPLVVVNAGSTLPDFLESPAVTLLNLPVVAVAVADGQGSIVGVVPREPIDRFIDEDGVGIQPDVMGAGLNGSTPDPADGDPQIGLATVRCRRCGTPLQRIRIFDPDNPPECAATTDPHRLESG
ncbi:hypothetical protein ACGFNV_03685 [Streptomyces sp. NPDC048751]|uniref:hypothetical protein n=1 Tax=Streptomyces sp. NPDC048751 TaxID=3365591 RepID=UPI0037109594